MIRIAKRFGQSEKKRGRRSKHLTALPNCSLAIGVYRFERNVDLNSPERVSSRETRAPSGRGTRLCGLCPEEKVSK